MIVPTDIANILYRDCGFFGIDIVPQGETLTGELKSERIVIHSKPQQPGKIWKKSFVEVNLCVPDLRENEANTIRLNWLEREAMKQFDSVGIYDDTVYRYSVEAIGMEADTALKCHYVNVRILFGVLNMIFYDIVLYKIVLQIKGLQKMFRYQISLCRVNINVCCANMSFLHNR